jgi:glutathione-regulated potassium-efflux system ancillary protein KefC
MKEALIFLAAAVVCVPIAARFGMGSVLGYLLAGAAIGPWGLKLIPEAESAAALAELGVVLMLFVIGLELDPKRLMEMRRQVFGGGSLQLGVCGLVLGVALAAMGLPWEASVIAGLALGMSSTAVSLQAMTERNELPTPTGGRPSRCCSSRTSRRSRSSPRCRCSRTPPAADGQPAWLRLLTAAAAIAGVVFIGRYLTRPLLRLIAGVQIRELFTAFALLLVLGVAELVSLAGLSMALGASSPACCSPTRSSATRSRR